MLKIMDVDVDRLNSDKILEYQRVIMEFNVFQKSVDPILLKIREDLTKYLIMKQRSIASHKDFVPLILRYEDLNLNYYADNHWDELVFKNP